MSTTIIRPVSRDDVIGLLSRKWFSDTETRYLNHHAQRFAETLAMLQPLISKPSFRLLDVGPHMLTGAIAEQFHSVPIQISTIGWWSERLAPESLLNHHLDWDLNVELPEGAHPDGPFDGILMAETIEHLHTSPKIVLGGFARQLRPSGWLCLQTPNAAALSKRIRLLLGRNPYEMIREDTHNPGHFREYTMNELISIGQEAGLTVTRASYMNYWRSRGWRGVAEDLRPTFRNGLTVIFTK